MQAELTETIQRIITKLRNCQAFVRCYLRTSWARRPLLFRDQNACHNEMLR